MKISNWRHIPAFLWHWKITRESFPGPNPPFFPRALAQKNLRHPPKQKNLPTVSNMIEMRGTAYRNFCWGLKKLPDWQPAIRRASHRLRELDGSGRIVVSRQKPVWSQDFAANDLSTGVISTLVLWKKPGMKENG
jgi:hypothetical protein